MDNVEIRPVGDIVRDIKQIRVQGAVIDWSLKDIIADMQVLAGELIVDTNRVLEKGNKAAAKRVRDYTKSLETLGLAFRKKSI